MTKTVSRFSSFSWKKTLRTAIVGSAALAVPALAQAQYTYVPSNNQNGNWNAANRWTGGEAGTFPNAVDATATINLPASTAPSGNYNLQLSNTAGESITVGSIVVNNSAATLGNLRIGANGNGTLTFQSSAGSASYTENPGDPDSTNNTVIFAPVTFASDTIITQNHNLTGNSGTQFSSSNNSPGGTTAAPNITVTKEGAGNIEFNDAPTEPGSGFQGSIVINQGAVRANDNVFVNAAAVTVNDGGQFQLGSSTVTNWSIGAGSVLTLNGLGKSGNVNPAGALRFQNVAASASFDNAVVLASDSSVFVNSNDAPNPPALPTAGKLTLSQNVSGAGGLVKDGGGVLELTAANTYEGDTAVNKGTLLVNNAEGSATGAGSVTILAGATLGGSGFIDGAVSFAEGILAPGNSAGTLTLGSTSFDSLSQLVYELATPGIVGSGVNDLTVVEGDLSLAGTLSVTGLAGFGEGTYRLFDYTGSLLSLNLTIGQLPGGLLGTIDSSIANQINLQVSAVPEPSSIALVAVGGVILGGAGLRRRRRQAIARG